LKGEKNEMIRTKRIYEEKDKNDGKRVLVDRIWPRGISKEDAKLDEWLKELAPSSDLRKWFDHDSEKFTEFKKRYKDELKDNKQELDKLRKWSQNGTVTLLYAAKDEEHNQAVVIKELLK
jgi:uncharacterized protein YeaO (DUF488 family)